MRVLGRSGAWLDTLALNRVCRLCLRSRSSPFARTERGAIVETAGARPRSTPLASFVRRRPGNVQLRAARKAGLRWRVGL